MSKITVWPDRFVNGWDGDDSDPPTFPTVDAISAFRQVYSTHAHFVPYYLEGLEEIPRMNIGAIPSLGSARLMFDIGIADIDDKLAHKEKRASSDDWREEIVQKLESLPIELAWYQTRAGIHVIWEYEKSLTLPEWEASTAKYIRIMSENGVIADVLPWGQPYGLPFVVRNGKQQNWPAKLDYLPVLQSVEAESKPLKGLLAGIQDAKSSFELPDNIPSGERNRILCRYAAQLRRRGLRQAEILVLIKSADLQRCNPPIASEGEPGEAELRKISFWADAQEGNPDPPNRGTRTRSNAPTGGANVPCSQRSQDQPTLDLPESPEPFLRGSEQELAEWLLSEVINVGYDAPAVYDRGCLWRFCKIHGIWESVFPAHIHNLIGKLDGAFFQRGADDNGDAKFGTIKVKAQLRTSVAKIVYDESNIQGYFDDAANGLTFRNGFVEIKEGTVALSAFTPEQKSTHCLDYDYTEGAMPQLWLQTLKEIWRDDDDQAEKIQMLREFIGICLLNRAGKYQKAVILLGDGENGKSVIMKVIRAMFLGKTISSVPPQEMHKEYNRAKLADARINIVAEMPDNEILDSASVKAMISADVPVMARRIYGEPFDYLPMFGNIFDANTLPLFRDMSHGFKRRWLILTFNRIFSAEDRDVDRAEKIKDQELALVASWALDGARDLLYRTRYAEPISSQNAVNEWREGSDICFAFVNECCEKLSATDVEKLGVLPGRLYEAFAAWAKRNGHERPMTSMFFYKRINRIIKPHHSKLGNKYPVKLNKVAALFS